VKIILPLQGYILVAGDPRISHNGRTAPRLCLYQGPLRFKGPCMVGPKLMPELMGDKIDIVMISLRGNGGRIGTALPGIYTDRCDIPGVPAILIFVKEMANIVIGRPYDRIKGVLGFRIEVYAVGIRIFVGIDNLVVVCHQFQTDAQIGLENFVHPSKGSVDTGQGVGYRTSVEFGIFPRSRDGQPKLSQYLSIYKI